MANIIKQLCSKNPELYDKMIVASFYSEVLYAVRVSNIQ